MSKLQYSETIYKLAGVVEVDSLMKSLFLYIVVISVLSQYYLLKVLLNRSKHTRRNAEIL